MTLMPKKKSFNLSINYDEKLNTVSAIFGLPEKDMDALMVRFRENIKAVAKIKPKFKIAEVIAAAAAAATSDTELAYIFFRIGKEHEQQNMRQAADFAEKVIIPALQKTPKFNDGKLPN